MATSYFIAGLVLVALGVGAIAGPWWGVVVAGVELITLGVLTESTPRAAKKPKP